MKIAVTDACIFIDLHDLDLIASFFNLKIEIHTTTAVYFELYPEQQLVLKAYQSVGRLEIHILRKGISLKYILKYTQDHYQKPINRFFTSPIN